MVAGAALATSGLAVAPAAAAEGGGNRGCGEGFTALKIDRAPILGEVITDGTYSATVVDLSYKADGSGEVYGFAVEDNLDDPDDSFDPVVYVVVKGGPTSIRHRNGQTEDLDTGLSPGGRHYAISNVTFCYQVA